MRILILSLYFPPLQTIAAQRAFSFYNFLKKNGHEVSVITRYYDEGQIVGDDMLLGQKDARNCPEKFVINPNYENVYYTSFISNSNEKKIFDKLPKGLKGLYNFYKTDIYHSGWIAPVLQTLETILKEKEIDVVIGTYGPPIILSLTNDVAMRCKSKMVVDFRDSYVDERDKGIKLYLKRLIQVRYLSVATGLVFATKAMEVLFKSNASSKRINQIPSICVYNGVENIQLGPDLNDAIVVDRFNELVNQNKKVLLHTGTLYEGQNIQFFIQALNSYSRKQEILLVFVGLSKNGRVELVESDQIAILGKVSIGSSIDFQRRAHALVLPIWDGRYTGFSGKLIEYLNSGTPVITSPNPQSDLNEFFNFSGNVHVAMDEKVFHQILDGLLNESIKSKVPLKPEYFQRIFWLTKLNAFLSELKN